jgi:hypothetical protein
LERFIIYHNMNDIIEEAKGILSCDEAIALGIKFTKI